MNFYSKCSDLFPDSLVQDEVQKLTSSIRQYLATFPDTIKFTGKLKLNVTYFEEKEGKEEKIIPTFYLHFSLKNNYLPEEKYANNCVELRIDATSIEHLLKKEDVLSSIIAGHFLKIIDESFAIFPKKKALEISNAAWYHFDTVITNQLISNMLMANSLHQAVHSYTFNSTLAKELVDKELTNTLLNYRK